MSERLRETAGGEDCRLLSYPAGLGQQMQKYNGLRIMNLAIESSRSEKKISSLTELYATMIVVQLFP